LIIIIVSHCIPEDYAKIMRYIPLLLMTIILLNACGQISNQKESQKTSYPDLSGKHGLTLQWIDWTNWGEVIFHRIDSNTYHIQGSQIGNKEGSCPDCSVHIDGTIMQINATTLKFQGRIESKVTYNNNGLPCVREGEFDFVATEGKKYWRCHPMEGCDGSLDYVDIYF
jgi:uncharacterized protein YceK